MWSSAEWGTHEGMLTTPSGGTSAFTFIFQFNLMNVSTFHMHLYQIHQHIVG